MGTIRARAVTGGPDNPPTLALVRQLQELDRSRLEWDGPGVSYQFTIEGAAYKPQWQGVKVHRFNRVDGVLEVDVAVSWERLVNQSPRDILVALLQESVPLVEAYLTKRRLAYRNGQLAGVLARYDSATSGDQT